jgi:hypothetical protein
MLFPEDKAERKRMEWRTMVAVLLDQGAKAGDEMVEIHLDDLVELVAASQLERMPEVISQRVEGGHVTGEILRHLLSFSVHCPDHASVHKAIHVACQELRESGGGRQVAASRSSVRPHWSRFKPVSHLWAALPTFSDLALEAGIPELHVIDASDESLLVFLAIAEWIRKQAESIVPHAQEASAFDRADTWIVPEVLQLPDIDISISAPSEEALQALQQYRAR